MRRVFVIRKDLNMKPGKLAAMVGHCAEAFWTNLLKDGPVFDQEYEYLPTETDNDPDYWKRYRHPAVYEAAKEAHEKGLKTFKFKAEFPVKKYGMTRCVDKDIWDEYVNGIFTKTICEAKNLAQLKQKVEAALEEIKTEFGVELVEVRDYGYINDRCLTDLTPENPDGTTTVGVWFKPLKDDIAHKISRKFKLYGAFDK